MIRAAVFLFLILHFTTDNVVHCKKITVTLSDSYLPVAMQVIAHLTDQMAFEVKDDPNLKPTMKPSSKPPSKPISSFNDPVSEATRPTTQNKPSYTNKPIHTTNRPSFVTNKPTYGTSRPTYMTNRPTYMTNKPTYLTNKPTYMTNKPTYMTNRPTFSTNRPTFVTTRPTDGTSWQSTSSSIKPNDWMVTYTTPRIESTTSFHRPGVYAPIPPRPSDRYLPKEHFVLLPVNQNSQYTFINPFGQPTSEAFLLPESHSEVKPIVEPKPNEEPLLPFEEAVPMTRAHAVPIEDYELNDENLQYLNPDLKDMLKLANDPYDERAIDIWGSDVNRRAYLQQTQNKSKLSSSNLRLLLLYDLLSREAKRQRLSDYSGYSPALMKELTESANGGARSQLRFALSRMIERKDCQHEYANNRAKEMIEELGRDESGMSSEIRYLEPLIYHV